MSSRIMTKSLSQTDINQDTELWGQAILRAKTSLIKPHSKYIQEGIRPRTPNEPYTRLTDEQISSIDKTSSPIFFHKEANATATGAFRRFRQRETDSVPMSQLRTGGAVGGGSQYTFVTPEAYTSKLPELYNGCGPEAYPKWYPNRAGERTLSHFRNGEPVERFVSIDMYRRPPTGRPGQIIFDHGRPNDGYYLQRNGYETTWFGSNVPLNRHEILESIQQKTCAEYDQIRADQQDKYRQANNKWPHLSEYGDQFVIKSTTKHAPQTDLERAKQHIAQNPTRLTSLHNQITAQAVADGRTLVNESPLVVKC